jgi:hypothetical protein
MFFAYQYCLQIDIIRKLNRTCQNVPSCSSMKRAETFCEFFDDISKCMQCGWLCDICVKLPSCRANGLRKKMDLRVEIENLLKQKFQNTGWKLVDDRPLGRVAVMWDECSVEFQLESEIKV